MFDCGIPFSRMKEELYKCKYLFITHTHSDHINPRTLLKICEEFPRIQIYGNYDVAYQYHVNHIIGTEPFEIDNDRTVYPCEGVHDVPVTYYIVKDNKQDLNYIYATDTSKISNPTDLMFDYCFLESNYDEIKLFKSGVKYKRKGYDPTESSYRHLSTKQCKTFYFLNRRNKDSQLIELHMSNRFY